MLQNAQKISALYFDFDRCRQLVRVCVCVRTSPCVSLLSNLVLRDASDTIIVAPIAIGKAHLVLYSEGNGESDTFNSL